jgi:hypothetical protein
MTEIEARIRKRTDDKALIFVFKELYNACKLVQINLKDNDIPNILPIITMESSVIHAIQLADQL